MTNNPARDALTRAVQRAITNGAPIYVNQPVPLTPEQPLHFEGCHPGSGEYHQTFHRLLRTGICPGCHRPLTDGAYYCRLSEFHKLKLGNERSY